MVIVKGHDGAVRPFGARDQAVAYIKAYLSQWMVEGDRISWAWLPYANNHKPDYAQVITEFGEPTDAYAKMEGRM